MADPNIRDQVLEILSDPMNLPPDFWAYATQNWLKDAPTFPISQVFGFTQFSASTAVTAASQTRSSSTYGDLATVGPTLTGLPDGHYLVLWGCNAIGSTGVTAAQMAVQLNSGSPPSGDNAQVARCASSSEISIVRFDTFTISNNNSSTLTAKYASSDNTTSCTFSGRTLTALKYANL